ncbi:MAG: HNH endonuclease [Anaerolineae bacterium]|nr:HNH endonuclease [Anaerolineae bacterium]
MNELTSWAATVRFVHQRANNCCEYCQTCQRVTGQAMHVEHIDPQGGDHPDNLCLSCPNCNLSKAKRTTAHDPDTNSLVPLFNPRTQNWLEHFRWIENGQWIEGISPIGRATIINLKMNMERIIIARAIWISAGKHPPR